MCDDNLEPNNNNISPTMVRVDSAEDYPIV